MTVMMSFSFINLLYTLMQCNIKMLSVTKRSVCEYNFVYEALSSVT